jgi:hypothetical protein
MLIKKPRRAAGRRKARPAVEGLEPRTVMSNVSVLTYHYDGAGSGNNPGETTLTPTDVNSAGFGKLFSAGLDGATFAEPLYVSGVNITTAGSPVVHNVVYVATEHDSVYAFDADSGALLWHDSLLDPIHGGVVTTVPTSVLGVANLGPEEGITSTPVIDASRGWIYVVAETLEVVGGANHYVQQIHALDLGSGAERPGGSALIADTIFDGTNYAYVSGPSVAGTGNGSVNGVITYNALRQSQRTALAENNGTIYVASASQGDFLPFHGWILGYSASSLALTTAFNATPNGVYGGIWVGGGGLAFDAQGDMFVVVGNGTFDGLNGSDPNVDSGGPGPITGLNAQGFPVNGDYGDCVLKLAVDPTTTVAHPGINGYGLKVLDYFAPNNQTYLAFHDLDFGSQEVALLPASSGSAAHPDLLEVAGKEGKVYLLDQNNLGKFGTTTDAAVQEIANGAPGGSYGTPAVFDGSVYGISNFGHALRYVVSNATMTLSPQQSPDAFGLEGASPSISSNGATGGIVWAVDQGTGTLRAYDATNLSSELYTSAQAPFKRDALPGTLAHFFTPTVADGKVYVATNTGLVAYGVLTGPVLPLVVNGAPFGVHNPDVQTAEVTGLYNTILGRAPDAPGLAAWVGALKSGDTVAQVASAFLGSAEYQANVVASYYRTFLGQAGSSIDISAWVAAMQGGLSEEQVAFDFLASPGFSALHPDNADFVQTLYIDVLGRPANLSEMAAWTSAFGSGISRPAVVHAVLGSTEAAARALNGIYTIFLARPADPSGSSYWVTALGNGATLAQVAAAIAGSPEFATRANASVG